MWVLAVFASLKRETMFGRCAKEDSQIFVKRKKYKQQAHGANKELNKYHIFHTIRCT